MSGLVLKQAPPQQTSVSTFWETPTIKDLNAGLK